MMFAKMTLNRSSYSPKAVHDRTKKYKTTSEFID